MADLLVESTLLVMFLTYGAVSRSSRSTFHVAGRVIKHEGLKEIYPLPSNLTPLACSATSLPDRNFHTSGDCAAATDPYVPGFKSSRDNPHHTKKSNMSGAF